MTKDSTQLGHAEYITEQLEDLATRLWIAMSRPGAKGCCRRKH